MRKLLSFLLIFNLAHATAPTGYKNETASSKTYAQDLVFPNNQLTKQAGLDSRIETGNTNLLTNPSFEHSTVTTGWTITNATATADTTNQVEGKKALSLALTGALSVVQDSTINAANLVGLQGVARIKIKTSDVDGLKVCARNAGVTSTSLCINVPKDGAWKEINIPYILTATSNGIAITSTGTSGTVKLDDAFVGTSSPFQGVNGAKLVGLVDISSCASSWSTSSTSFADFSATTGCVYSTYGQAQAPSTMIPAIKFASLPAGDYRLEYEGQLYNNVTAKNSYYRFWDGTNYARETSIAGTVAASSPGMSQSISYSTAQTNITISIRAKTDSGGNAYVYGNGNPNGVIKVWYFPPESKIYSQASQDYDWTSYTPTFTGFGTVSNIGIWHKREGSDLLIKGNFTTGTLTAVTPQFTLPSGLTIDTSKVPSAVSVCSVSQRGISAATGNQYTNYIAINPSTPTVIKFATGNNGLTGTNEITNTTLSFGNNEVQSFAVCRIPIQGWQDYGVIVGSFANIPTVASVNAPKLFSANITSTSGAVSNNMGGVISSCTAANPTVCSLTGLTATPNCSTSSKTSSTQVNQITASSASSITISTTASSQSFDINCMGY